MSEVDYVEGSLTADRGKPMAARAVGFTESTVPIGNLSEGVPNGMRTRGGEALDASFEFRGSSIGMVGQESRSDPSQQSGGSVLLFGMYETMGANEGRNASVEGSESEYSIGADIPRKAMGKTLAASGGIDDRLYLYRIR